MSKVDKVCNDEYTWNKIAYNIAKVLTREQLLALVLEAFLKKGVSERDAFFDALEATLGEDQLSILILENEG
jgi:hypothetical protein